MFKDNMLSLYFLTLLYCICLKLTFLIPLNIKVKLFHFKELKNIVNNNIIELAKIC